MGYKSKLIIVETDEYGIHSEVIGGRKVNCCFKVAEYDLGVVGNDVINSIYKWEETKYFIADYIYHDDSGTITNEYTITDRYGDVMKMGTLEQAIKALRIGLAESPNYCVYSPILRMLEQMKCDKEDWGNIMVLHYGH